MEPDITYQYNDNLLNLDRYEKTKSLYLVDFNEGEIQEKTGFGWLFAQAVHLFYRVCDATFGTEYISQAEKEKYREIFARNADFRADPKSKPKKISPTDHTPAQLETIKKVKRSCQDILVRHLRLPSKCSDMQYKLVAMNLHSKDLQALLKKVKQHPNDKITALPEDLSTVNQCIEASAIIKEFFTDLKKDYSDVLKLNWDEPLSPEMQVKRDEFMRINESIDIEQFKLIHAIANASQDIKDLRTKQPEYISRPYNKIIDTNILKIDLSKFPAPDGVHPRNLQDLKNEFEIIMACIAADEQIAIIEHEIKTRTPDPAHLQAVNLMKNIIENDERFKNIRQVAKDYKNNPAEPDKNKSDPFIKQFSALHREFDATKTAKVEIADGDIVPVRADLEKAFTLVTQTHFKDMLPPESKAAGAFLARLVQYVMVGDKISKVSVPYDDLCFTCKELVELNEVIHLPQNKNPVENHVKGDAYQKAIRENVPAGRAAIDTMIDYLNKHFIDATRRNAASISERQPFLTSEADKYDAAIKNIRQDYLEALNDSAMNLDQVQKANQKFCEAFALRGTKEQMIDILELARGEPSFAELNRLRKELIIRQTELTDEEAAPLIAKYRSQIDDAKTDAQIKEELEKNLRLHFLRVLLVWNQSSHGMAPTDIDPKSTKLPVITHVSQKMEIPVAYEQGSSVRRYRINPDSFLAEQAITFVTSLDGANERLGVRNNVQEQFAFLKVSQAYIIPSLTERVNPGNPTPKAVSINYANIRVRPHGLPYMQKVFDTFAPEPTELIARPPEGPSA